MNTTEKVLILDKMQIQQKINRIAYQILEDNLNEKEIVLAGIWGGGYKLVLRLKEVLQKIAPFSVTIVRIDLEKKNSILIAKTDTSESEWKNKAIILIDDVLNSGKTLSYALVMFMSTAVKKIRTAVLVDRSHKIFPMAIDYAGVQIATVLKEHATVVLDDDEKQDSVYLS